MEGLNPLFSMVRDFLMQYLPIERKCSAHTVRSYQKALELFLDYIKTENNIPLSKVTFDMIDRNILSDFLNHLETTRKCSSTTRNHRLHSIRAFYNYAAENNITLIAHWDEILKVKPAKTAGKLVDHMSETAIGAIIATPDVTTKQGLRDMFMMLLLYRTGARIQELLDIKISDVQFGKSPIVTLRGKGAKVRAVPLRPNTADHLKCYIENFHPDESIYSNQFLFFTVRNGVKKRMTEDNARNLIAKHGRTAQQNCTEVPDNVHPHLFRHSCAMSLYRSGVHLTLISQWLGHANLETTLIYAHADTEIKRKAIESAIPKETPLGNHTNSTRYIVDDEELLKKLCGLK